MSLSDFYNANLPDDATPDEYREWLGREKERIDRLIERLKVPRVPDALINIQPCDWSCTDAEFLRRCGISKARLPARTTR
jgi:hypothetical protein